MTQPVFLNPFGANPDSDFAKARRVKIVTPDPTKYHSPDQVRGQDGSLAQVLPTSGIPSVVIPHVDSRGNSLGIKNNMPYHNVVVDPHLADGFHVNMETASQDLIARLCNARDHTQGVDEQSFRMFQALREAQDNAVKTAAVVEQAPVANPVPQPMQQPAMTQPIFQPAAETARFIPANGGAVHAQAAPTYTAAVQAEPQMRAPLRQPRVSQSRIAQLVQQQPYQALVPASSSRSTEAGHPDIPVLFEWPPGSGAEFTTKYHGVDVQGNLLIMIFNRNYQGQPPCLPASSEQPLLLELPTHGLAMKVHAIGMQFVFQEYQFTLYLIDEQVPSA